MRIQVVTTQYVPDGGPSAPLFQMLCEQFARLGHQVCVISAVPHYPTGQVPPAFRHGWIQSSRENGVEVVRVRVPSVDRARLTRRLMLFMLYQLGAVIGGLQRGCDVMLVANPALETGIPFFFLSALRRKPTVFSVHDLYPDVGIELGIFRGKTIARLIAWSEQFCFRRSAYVRILSESFTPSLKRMGVPDEKLSLIYDWVDTTLIRPLERRSGFSAEHQLDNRFVVLYAGNIGLSQGLEYVLSAAQIMQTSDPDVQFVFVGEGAGREPLMAEAQRLGLENVTFLPFQPRARLPEVLATADVALVSLKPHIGTGSLPSKTFSNLASGRAILAIVEPDTATADLVQRAEAGMVVPPADPARIVEALRGLKADPAARERMGRAGRAFAEAHHSPEGAAAQFLALFERMVKRS